MNSFACFHSCLMALPASMLTDPFPLLLSRNENAVSDNKQHSTTGRSNHNYLSDSKAHHLPELSRMMDLRHTNSSPWMFIMRNRAAVASSMSKISTMPSTHFPWFLCEHHQAGDIHSFNLVAAWAFHPTGSIPSSLISSVQWLARGFLLCAHSMHVGLQKHSSLYPTWNSSPRLYFGGTYEID